MPVSHVPVAAAQSVPAPAAVPAAEEPPAAMNLAIIKSPIVGTFYRSPEPGAPSFVEVGDRVRKGQVLCIIEAMKLMNEIESETDGEITAAYVENGRPVQFGDRLFAIKVSDV
jgi:acetyl-CoA carboxylase biotin carboxyl carrier protein